VPILIEMTIPVYISRSLVVSAVFSSTQEEDEITKTTLRRLFRISTWPSNETASTVASEPNSCDGHAGHVQDAKDICSNVPKLLLSVPDEELDLLDKHFSSSIAFSQQEKDLGESRLAIGSSVPPSVGNTKSETNQQPVPLDEQYTIVIDWQPLTTPKACAVIRHLLPRGLLNRKYRTTFTVRNSKSTHQAEERKCNKDHIEHHIEHGSKRKISINSESHDYSVGSSKQITGSHYHCTSDHSYKLQDGRLTEAKHPNAEVTFSWRTGVRMGVFEVLDSGSGRKEVKIKKGLSNEDENAGCWG
jgi:hypothetical protein